MMSFIWYQYWPGSAPRQETLLGVVENLDLLYQLVDIINIICYFSLT